MSTSAKLKEAIKNQGRKKSWVADQLNISRVTLDKKLADNFWSVGELLILKKIGLL